MKFLLAVWKQVKVLMIALMHGFGALLIVFARLLMVIGFEVGETPNLLKPTGKSQTTRHATARQ